MSWLFTIRPDFRLLNKYGYTNLSMEALEDAIMAGNGVDFETEFTTDGITREDLLSDFLDLMEEYGLTGCQDTILFVTLTEHDHYIRVLFFAYETYESEKLAKELAKLLVCLHDTSENKISGLRLTTNTNAVKVTNKRLITWIGKLVRQGMERADFAYHELGEGAYHLLASDKSGIKFDGPLDYAKLATIADKTVRSPSTLVKKHLASFLHNVWQLIDNETPLTTAGEVKYTDRQLIFLFKLGEVFGCLKELAIDSEPKDYLRTLFENYIRP